MNAHRIIVSFPLSHLPPGVGTAEVGERVVLFGKPDAATVVRVQVDPERTNLVVTLDVHPDAGLSTALLDALEADHSPPVPVVADPAYRDALRGGHSERRLRPEPERRWHLLRRKFIERSGGGPDPRDGLPLKTITWTRRY